jgi:hypothetical protein
MSLLSKAAVLLLLAAVYYVALGLMPAVTYRLPIMEFARWLGASQSTASYAYLIGTHTIGVLLAALPIAIAFVLLFSAYSFWLTLLVSLPPLIDLVFGIWMFGGIGNAPNNSLEFTLFYLTDGVKIALAVPFLAWLISKYLPERRRAATD